MKVNLKQFQQDALVQLRKLCNRSIITYNEDQISQIISFTAPTGSGKTIILSALLEAIFFGDEMFPARPDSIAIWLSDDPELNNQSKEKIETRADKFRFGQCVTIADPGFDQEVFEDGKIYFINTQKLSVSSNLTKHSDTRNYTIWETFRNTIQQKSDRLYFIIDEAHRGAKGAEVGKATTIMQKFILGDSNVGLPKMPVVLGMSATVQRFNTLIANVSSTVHRYEVPTDEVRKSGLLKDKIAIVYPEEQIANTDMAVLQAATDEWMDKWNHWFQYCQEQHYTHVYPIMLVQVENGTSSRITNTDLADCISKIEGRYGKKFREGDIVHAFGNPKSTIEIGGLKVPFVEPSRIAESRDVKIVLFKDTLSTGWDCPRAETMMSFRRATDSTYIAQLLGRMIRTPLGMRVNVDESLNEVKLFLPHFDQNTVDEVVKKLKEIDGGNLPTEVTGQALGSQTVQRLTVNTHIPTPATPSNIPGDNVATVQSSTTGGNVGTAQTNTGNPTAIDTPISNGSGLQSQNADSCNTPTIFQVETSTTAPTVTTGSTVPDTTPASVPPASTEASVQPIPEVTVPTIDRRAILDFINGQGYANYNVRKVKINNYFTSLFKLSRLLMHSGIEPNAFPNEVNGVVELIHDYILQLKASGQYDNLVQKVMEFRLKQNVFDTFGKRVENNVSQSLFSTTDSDIDRQFDLSESKLGRQGVGIAYGNKYGDPNDDLSYKIDVILFVGDTSNLESMQDWAMTRFHTLKTNYRMAFVNANNKIREEYENIVRDGDAVSEYPLNLPFEIEMTTDKDGIVYFNHLYADNEGKAKFKLNTWEAPVLADESVNPNFVCWLRNPDRKRWSLCIPYEKDNETKPLYPDFLIVRKSGDSYIVDVLEPHRGDLDDNLPKAKGLAKYAATEQRIGRIQLIRLTLGIGGSQKIVRLDLTDSLIRDKVLHANTQEQLSDLFTQYGITQ